MKKIRNSSKGEAYAGILNSFKTYCFSMKKKAKSLIRGDSMANFFYKYWDFEFSYLHGFYTQY